MEEDIADKGKSWDVIYWNDETTVDYVPSIWGNKAKTFYKYPSPTGFTQTRLRKAINDCEDLPASTFQWHRATLKREGIKTLQHAKLICQKAEVTSNVDTTEEEMSQRKRKLPLRFSDYTGPKKIRDKPIQLVLSSSGSEEDEQSNHEVSRNAFNIPEDLPTDEELEHAHSSSVPQPNPSPESSPKEWPDTSSMSLLKPKTVRPLNELNLSAVEENASSIEKRLDKIIEGVAENNFLVKTCLRRIEIVQCKIRQSHDASLDRSDEKLLFANLPCQTEQDLQNAEELAQDHFDLLVDKLFLVGGDSPHKTVFAVMKRIISDQVALEYSSVGKKKKKSFCSLLLFEIVSCVVRKRYPDAPDDIIRRSVSLFLAQARTRIANKRNL